MKRLILFVILFCVAWLNAGVSKEMIGTAVFKIKPEYRSMLSVSRLGCGIASVDEKLASLKVNGIKQRFLTPKSAKHDIALIFSVSSPLPPLSIVNILEQDRHIQYAEVMYPDEVFAVPNDTEYAVSQYFAALEAEAAWDIHKGELGANHVILALTDTGCKWNHVDLAPNLWNNLGEDANSNGYTLYYNGSAWVMDAGDINGIDDDGNGKIDDLIGWDFMVSDSGGESNDPSDPATHGTYVSGIMAARTNNSVGTSSLSWNLTLMPLSCSYNGSNIYTGYEGMVYAAENGADVINCSWGSTSFSQAAQEVVNYVYGLGSIIVAAAGNSNVEKPMYPAGYQNVLATAALQNSGLKSTASNFGAYVDFGATNSMVRTTASSGGYATVNTGVSNATSYASPIASALVGLIKSYYPSLTQAEIITRIKGSCDDIDALNPSYIQKLGEGKLNARRALADVAPVPDDEIRLYLLENNGATEPNNNLAIEPGETISLNLRLRSYGAAASGATFTISSSSPGISILDNTEVMDIPADGYIEFSNAFSIYVLPSATSQYISITLNTSASSPVVLGSSINFSLPINAGGMLVWENVLGGGHLSGNYIRTRLQSMGYTVAYGNYFPKSFYSYDAVFLSFGNAGTGGNVYRFDEVYMYTALKDYLESGGKVYIDGGDVIGFDLGYYLPDVEGELDANEVLWGMLGIATAMDGSGSNPIDLLQGQAGTPTEGISFNSTNQVKKDSIDSFTPLSAYAKSAFEESGYGCVAVANTGVYGQRSFVFSYALSELADSVTPNTRSNLLTKIVQFFESDSFLGELESPQLSISVVSDSIRLSWLEVPMADYYHVYISNLPDAWDGVEPVAVYGTQYVLPPGEKAFFKVIAVAD